MICVACGGKPCGCSALRGLLNKRESVPVVTRSSLQVDASDNTLGKYSLICNIETEFGINAEDFDMVMFQMANAEPVIIESPAVVVKAVGTSGSEVQKRTYGVCAFALNSGNDFPTGVNPKSSTVISRLIVDYAPYEVVEQSKGGGYREAMGNWLNALSFTVLEMPRHGILKDANGNYVPNANYIGKDVVSFLVRGIDGRNQQFEVVVKNFLNVVSENDWNKITDANFSQYTKQYCGSKSEVWRISSIGGVPQLPSSETATSWATLGQGNITISFGDGACQSLGTAMELEWEPLSH